MPVSPESSEESVLDLCIDCLLAGADWTHHLPADQRMRHELTELMHVASTVARIAAGSAHIERTQQQRVWNRVEARMSPQRSKLRAIAFYRLPYLPPLWIRPGAV